MAGRVTSVITRHDLKLVGVPDQETRQGDRFHAESARVEVRAEVAYVVISGRAIRVDGTTGHRTRRRVFDLRNHSENLARELDWAPRWLDDLLASVGVEW